MVMIEGLKQKTCLYVCMFIIFVLFFFFLLLFCLLRVLVCVPFVWNKGNAKRALHGFDGAQLHVPYPGWLGPLFPPSWVAQPVPGWEMCWVCATYRSFSYVDDAPKARRRYWRQQHMYLPIWTNKKPVNVAMTSTIRWNGLKRHGCSGHTVCVCVSVSVPHQSHNYSSRFWFLGKFMEKVKKNKELNRRGKKQEK